jgi:carbamate kinase
VIRDLVRAGKIVIAAGGGGIPVIINGNGLFRGVEAVIDKDYVASMIAREAKAELFVILTNVSHVFLNYDKPDKKPLSVLPVALAQEYLEQGQFPSGSMGPKIEAAIKYIQNGGEKVIITSSNHLKASLIGRSGTKIISGNRSNR